MPKIPSTEPKDISMMLQALFDLSINLLCVAGLKEGYFKLINKAFEKIFGYTEAEMLKKPILDLVHPDDRSMTLSLVKRLHKGEPVVNFENRYLCKDGSYKWLAWTAVPALDRGLIYATGHDITERKKAEEELKTHRAHLQELVAEQTRDLIKTNEELRVEITERKRAEEALREGEERYRAMIENMSNAVAVYRAVKDGEDFVFVDFNRAGEKAEKIKKDAIIGKSVCESFPGVKNFGLFDVFQRVWKTGVPEHYPTAMYEDKRVSGWRENYVYKLPSGEIVAVYSDETEQKRVEEALRESEDKLKAIFENVNDEIVYLDSQGTVLDVNKRVEGIFGYKPEEIIGKNIAEIEFSSPDLKGDVLEKFNRDISKNFKSLMELVGKRKDGAEIHVEASTSLIEKDGEIKNILTVIRDVTERKRLEDQLRQAHKMEAIGTLAGGIAHEFNNILGIILGNSELAMDGVPEWNIARYNLEEIRTACLRAKDVVRQILAFSRQSKQEMKPLRLSSIIKDSLKLLRSSIPRSIEIRQSFTNRSDIILADPTQVNQVLINLCTNAAHAMRDGGGILEINLVDTKLLESDMNQYHDLTPGTYVKMTVRDTGCGVEPEIMDRIFDPYFTTKEVGEGSGMGLAVVHGIVKSHGGDITVRSVPHKGTDFHVLFPVIQAEVKEEPEAPKPLQRGSERILFIDDEESLVYTAKQTLESVGYHVTTQINPLKALEVFRKKPHSFDIVITDMTMPHMTGDRLAKEVLEIRPTIPVILCSGYSEQLSEEKLKKVGISAFVMKPVLVREMTKTIREVLDKESGS